MASLCKRQQCTIERRGFRQELDSWRHKLIHCVGKLSCHCVCASVCRCPGGRRAPGRRSFCVLLPPPPAAGAERRIRGCGRVHRRGTVGSRQTVIFSARSVPRGCCLALPPLPPEKYSAPSWCACARPIAGVSPAHGALGTGPLISFFWFNSHCQRFVAAGGWAIFSPSPYSIAVCLL